MAVESFGQAASTGNDGLQYLCAKYSSLISRLREELVARQQAEGQLRDMERQLSDQAAAQRAERAQWENERRALQNEVDALSALQRNATERRLAEAADLRHAAGTNAQLSARCDQLQAAVAEEARKTSEVMDKLAAGSETSRKQSDELAQLRRDCMELTVQHHSVYEDLVASREQLTRTRQAVAGLEDQVDSLTQARDDAEARAWKLQEELRAALRTAAVAREREREAAELAGRGERQIRSHEERLSAVRNLSERHARRAASAERRLATCENAGAAASQLALEVQELRRQLESESKAREAARNTVVRFEAAEAREAAFLFEARHEASAQSEFHAATKQRVTQLETELSAARVEAQQAEARQKTDLGAAEALRLELRDERQRRDEEWRRSEQLMAELAHTRRRLETTRTKEFRLNSLNARMRSQRPPCQEESRKYPSKCAPYVRRRSSPCAPNMGRSRSAASLSKPGAALVTSGQPTALAETAIPAAPTDIAATDASAAIYPLPPPPRPHPRPAEELPAPTVSTGLQPQMIRSTSDVCHALRNFVEQEDLRLAAMDGGGCAGSFADSPRRPSPARCVSPPPLPSPKAASPQAALRAMHPNLAAPVDIACRNDGSSAAALAASVAADRAGFASLLAAQPRAPRLTNELPQQEQPYP